MNDYIDVKLAFSNYIHNIADVIYRYINNDTLKKVLIFPLFILILALEIAIFPIALVGAIAKWMITLVVWLTEDRAQSLLYFLVVVFIELFLLYYVAFAILMLFYKLFNLLSNGLGRADYEANADEYIATHTMKKEEETSSEVKKNSDEVYVIDIDDYK